MSIITTLLAGAANYGLTDLATVMDELSLTTANTANDAWLTRAIAQVSSAVMSETNRIFAPEFVQDQIDVKRSRSQSPAGDWTIQLSRYPVLAITSLAQAIFPTPRTLIEGTDFRVDYETGELTRIDTSTGREIGWEPIPVTVRYSAGYGAAVREQHPVPGSGSHQVTVTQAATFSCDQTVAYANGTLLAAVASGPAQGQYSVAPATGTYSFNASDAAQTLSFTYCTKVIPDDLVDVSLRLITGRYCSRGRDPSLVQRDTVGVGTERFWFGGVPGQTGQFAPDIEAILNGYNVPVVA